MDSLTSHFESQADNIYIFLNWTISPGQTNPSPRRTAVVEVVHHVENQKWLCRKAFMKGCFPELIPGGCNVHYYIDLINIAYSCSLNTGSRSLQLWFWSFLLHRVLQLADLFLSLLLQAGSLCTFCSFFSNLCGCSQFCVLSGDVLGSFDKLNSCEWMWFYQQKEADTDQMAEITALPNRGFPFISYQLSCVAIPCLCQQWGSYDLGLW